MTKATTSADLNHHAQKPPGNEQPSPAATINSLAPKVLSGEDEIKSIQPYLESLKLAVQIKGVNNIALTGNYGSGKSTILRTFEDLNKQYQYLNISLASFNKNRGELDENSSAKQTEKTPVKQDEKEFEQQLEISILQQMFYHVKPSEIPDSRFKRIEKLSEKKLWLFSVILTLWVISLLLLFPFNHFPSLNPANWSTDKAFDWVATVSGILFFSGICLMAKTIYPALKNSKINKLTIKGELELGENIDKSVFNQHLEEILYFFESTKYDVVIIEDLDRFESTNIFTKLREINILINNSKSIARSIKFVYAIKDEMFTNKNERVKFFEYIIPVIPFINPSNARDQLTKLIDNADLQGVLSKDFTSDLITFIDDIDMRLLINIFHEYQFYRKMLGTELNQDNLFAIVTYKNLYPDDFGKLQKRSGHLFNFFNNKPSYLKSLIERNNERIEEIEEELNKLDNSLEISIKELRLIYVAHLVAKLDKFNSFHLDGEVVTILNALETKHFEILKNTRFVEYYGYVSGYHSHIVQRSNPIYSEVGFGSIEKEVSSITYKEREKRITERLKNKINILNNEKTTLKSKNADLKSLSIQKILEFVNPEDVLGHFKDNRLMRNLLINGYINEHYEDYISLFHGVTLTRDDFNFERSLKSGYDLPLTYKLTRIENLIKKVPDHYFKRSSALNFDIANFLLENESRFSSKIENFFNGLSIDGERQFEFINEFVSHNSKNQNKFISKLCKTKPSLWRNIYEKNDLPTENIEILIKSILNYGDLADIEKFEAIDKLDTYLSTHKRLFSFASELSEISTMKSLIKRRNILFEELDTPASSQQELLDYIYQHRLYQLNDHNIRLLLIAKSTISIENLNVSYYSTILRSGLKELLSYINDNFQKYVEGVLLQKETNKKEEESVVIDILNRNDVDLEIKGRFISSQETQVKTLTSITSPEVKRVTIEQNKVSPSWENFFDYFKAADLETLDDTLANYLNLESVYKTLANSKLQNLVLSHDELTSMSKLILQTESLHIDSYSALVNAVLHPMADPDVNNLSDEKIAILINKDKLSLNESLYTTLKKKNDDLHIRLIEKRQGSLTNMVGNLDIEADDWNKILRSTKINNTNKREYIKLLEGEIITENPDIAAVACEVLSKEAVIELSNETIEALVNSNNSLKIKIDLLNRYIYNLPNEIVENLVKILGEDYQKIFLKKHKPHFPDTPYNRELFKKLADRNLIIRYEPINDKNELKVLANYN
jgi:energy-coupling factor transporter ATP-binding protein EcfA2